MGVILLRTSEDKPCVSEANLIELRGRFPRNDAEAVNYLAWRDFYEGQGGH